MRVHCLLLVASTVLVAGCRSPLTRTVDRPSDPKIAGKRTSTDDAPASPGESLKRGHAAYEQGRYDEAQRHYRRVLRGNPRQAIAHHRLGIIADKQQDYATAESHYRQSLAENPGDVNVLSDLGYSYFLQERYPECERHLSEALRVDPRHKWASRNLGLLYGTQKDYDRAFRAFLRSSDEQQAHELMAKLFPEANRAKSVAANDPRAREPGTDSGALTSELKQLMERERIKAIAGRRGGTAQHADYSVPHGRPGGVQHAGATLPTTARPGQPPDWQGHPAGVSRPQPGPAARDPRSDRDLNADRFRGRRLPDSRINDALRAIDEGAPRGRRTTATPTGRDAAVASHGRTAEPSAASKHYLGNDVREGFGRHSSPAPAPNRRVQPAGFQRHDPPYGGQPETAAPRRLAAPSPGGRRLWPPVNPDLQRGRQPQPIDPAAYRPGGQHMQPDPRFSVQPNYDHRVQGQGQATTFNDARRQAMLMGLNAGPGSVFPTSPGSEPPNRRATTTGQSDSSKRPAYPQGQLHSGGSQYPQPRRILPSEEWANRIRQQEATPADHYAQPRSAMPETGRQAYYERGTAQPYYTGQRHQSDPTYSAPRR